MSSWDALWAGWSHVFSWPGILIPMAGTLLAMLASFLPGLGNASVAVLAMVMTLHWDPTSVLLLFGALTGGATFMGSITAIVFNIPGSVSSTPALLDGYPMSRRGLTRTAIACAATASAVGSVFGVLVLLTILPVVEPWILKVGPLEILLIGLLGLMTMVSIPSQSHLKAACMVGLGLLLAMVGSEPLQGLPRWSLGSLELGEGIGIVPMMMGLFTLAELIEWMRPAKNLQLAHRQAPDPQDSTARGVKSVFKNLGLTLRSSTIGTLVGMVPGIGGTVAGFVAYGHAVQSNPKDPQPFGQGNIKGLIAPEAAVDAKDGGSLLPTLALGLPGSEACVILLAVFAMHGLVPGTPMLTTHLTLTYTLILALLFSNVLTSLVGIWIAPALSQLRSFRIDRIALPALLICVVSAVQLEGRITDLYVMLVFGVLGYFWRTHDWPRIPFVIAFVLGSMIEKNLALTQQLVSVGRIDLFSSTLALGLVFVLLALTGWWWVTQSRRVEVPALDPPGLGLGLLALGLSGLMLLIAGLEPEAYSTYAWTVAGVTAVLSATVVAQALLHRKRGVDNGPVLSDLRWVPGHGHALCLMGVLFLSVVLLGVGPAVALVVALWLSLRHEGERSVFHWRVSALVWGVLLGLLVHWVLFEWANVMAPSAVLWDLWGVNDE
jgi:putative tricarboxylic transport membrane protein